MNCLPAFAAAFPLLLIASLVAGSASSQIMQLPHSDTTSGNYFGVSVALDGHQAIVGASAEDSCGESGGAAYIFARNDTTGYWEKQARLVPENCESGLYFGRKVDLQGDHALIASSREFFAAEKPNTVYYYRRDSTGVWQELQHLNITREQEEGAFGFALSMHDELAVISTSGDVAQNRHGGVAYVYELQDGQWGLRNLLTSVDGVRNGIFGGTVTLADNHAVVTSSGYFNRRPGSVHLFAIGPEGPWIKQLQLTRIKDAFISVSGHDRELLIGQSRGGRRRSGIATLLALDSTDTWQQTATLVPPTTYRDGAFGTEVALSGDRALVVGYDEQLQLDYNVDRVVYVYARRNGEWQYQGIIDIGAVSFASSVDLDGPYALIGASSADTPGAAYVVRIP